MSKFVVACLLILGMSSTARAQDTTEAVVPLLAKERAQGCRGHAGVTAPLRWSASLARAAGRIERGEGAQAAIDREGFRATRVFQASFTGYRSPAEVADAMAQHYCSALAEPAFTDAAVQRHGTTWLVVLAARLQFPELDDPRAVARKVLALVNDARAHPRRCGDQAFDAAPPLQFNAQLGQAAAQHVDDMASHQYLSHTARDGSTPSQRISRTGYRWRAVGENLAAGQGTPEDVVQDWLSSPGHCANLMNREYVDMGLAFAVNMAAKAPVYWAQEFGRPR